MLNFPAVYIGVEFILGFIILYTLLGLIGPRGEKRILVYFIYFELIQLLMILLLSINVATNADQLPTYMTIILFIIAASGAETAVLLALFMAYFRLTGLTVFETEHVCLPATHNSGKPFFKGAISTLTTAH